MIQVRHRSHATYSRQPRQVRKEATVTGSCVCSGSPVPGLFLLSLAAEPTLHLLYNSLRKKSLATASNLSSLSNSARISRFKACAVVPHT